MQTYTVQLRKRGQLTLPRKVRSQLAVDEGDALTLLQIDDIVLLSPKRPLLPKLAKEFSALMDEEGVSLADLLQGLQEEREKIWHEQHEPAA